MTNEGNFKSGKRVIRSCDIDIKCTLYNSSSCLELLLQPLQSAAPMTTRQLPPKFVLEFSVNLAQQLDIVPGRFDESQEDPVKNPAARLFR